MGGLECVCTEQMRASCNISNTNYTILLMCAKLEWWLWRELHEEEMEMRQMRRPKCIELSVVWTRG